MNDSEPDVPDEQGSASGSRSTPRAPHVAAMTWRDGLFAHWPVDPGDLRPHVPDQVTLETRDGRAWVSVLPFVLADVGLRGSPSIVRTAFPELNVRTYVRYGGDSGLFFFSIDVGDSVIASLVRRTTRLPVRYARMRIGADGNEVAFSSRRSRYRTVSGAGEARFDATYGPTGETFRADHGTLEYWLTERRRFYAPERQGVLTGEIAHDRWPLRPAEVTIHENTLFEANGLPEPEGEPVCYFCGELEMTGSIPRRLQG
ncbi:hypothetical protein CHINAEXTREME_03370 [Halobiforma lacisalsi AJ5]|uniref:DUF2071 domain-containing protein n=1 Tax=Natronobacterium lacisalsi AJ5 TaxID=358396 RepID=M0LN13_NATLA|nr:DUF2071 domain-containing protein [Halobiforma lacisalsi]APW96866.1 hypothetical protein CHINAEXTREME_03370 [Halobiforma lacisalsi AJ5]EMA34896.1 hypothetical protein C445_06598 [Halobiforma lacisalsi AJ5]